MKNVGQKCERSWWEEAGIGGHKPHRYETSCERDWAKADETPSAGGGAGMMEALVCHPLGQWLFAILLVGSRPTDEKPRYHQGPDAAFETKTSAWGLDSHRGIPCNR